MKRVSCIGLGRVGITLTRAIASVEGFEIGELVSKSFESAQRAQKEIQKGTAVHSIHDIKPSALIIIATNDDSIKSVAVELSTAQAVETETVVFHCSGALTSTILMQGRIKHAAGIHPLKSFASPERAGRSFAGTLCAVEGEEYACGVVEALFIKLGAKPFRISPDKKPMYHAGSVFASNYLHALYDIADGLFAQCGIESSKRGEIIHSLMQGTLDNIAAEGHVSSLTGPAVRGDTEILKKHLDALEVAAPDAGALYKALAGYLVNNLTKR